MIGSHSQPLKQRVGDLASKADSCLQPKMVNYFKDTLQRFFLKGATDVYLYRLLSFNHRRCNTESVSSSSCYKD